MMSLKVEPRYKPSSNSKVGLIALATDFMIEKDFINITNDMNIDILHLK